MNLETDKKLNYIQIGGLDKVKGNYVLALVTSLYDEV